jgi:hypothetical protein
MFSPVPEPETPCPDPLLARVSLPLHCVCFPLGFPLEIRTNSPHVKQAVQESWGVFVKSFNVPPLRVSIGVTPGHGSLPAPPVFRSRGHLMSVISDAANFLTCDFSRGEAFGWVSEAIAAERAFFRYHFLEAAVLSMLEQLHAAPIHGALVARNGRGVLLCGESSAGKSTLAYTCARAGWTFVTDDCSFLLRGRDDLFAIGNCSVMRFRADAPSLFPELQARSIVIRPNGKAGLEVFTRDLPVRTAPGCGVSHLVFLQRAASATAELSSFPKDAVLAWLTRFSRYGEEHVRTAQVETYKRLTAAAIHRLTYGNPDDALVQLEKLIHL